MIDIKSFIKEQFPDIYHREGQTFIAFLEAYYDWLEQNGNIVDHIEKLPDYNDIDKTLDEFLEHFVEKYMTTLPPEVVKDRRFLQKHILDLYNSKGSPEGLRLLFMLLYGEEIDIYVPSRDILTADEGEWYVPTYIEIEYETWAREFQGKKIFGLESGANALVESYEKRIFDNRIVHTLFVSHVEGEFKKGEAVYTEELGYSKPIIIKGSVVALDINDGLNFKIGDVLYDQDRPRRGMKCVVTETIDSKGIMKFTLIDGGKGYGMDAVITISQGTNTTGSGASFRIGAIKDTVEFQYSNNLIQDHANVILSATTYDNGNGDTSAFATADINTLLVNAFEMQTKTVGTIDYILVDSVGSNYDGSLDVSIIDLDTSPYKIPDGKGGYWGEDAIVEAKASIGSGIVSDVYIVDSGFGYSEDDEVVRLTDGNKTVSGKRIIGGVGKGEGYWVDQKSFIDYDKYLQDDYYYQEFSYEIKSSKSFQKYKDIVKKIMHLAGNEMFGQVAIKDRINLETQDTVVFTP